MLSPPPLTPLQHCQFPLGLCAGLAGVKPPRLLRGGFGSFLFPQTTLFLGDRSWESPGVTLASLCQCRWHRSGEGLALSSPPAPP